LPISENNFYWIIFLLPPAVKGGRFSSLLLLPSNALIFLLLTVFRRYFTFKTGTKTRILKILEKQGVFPCLANLIILTRR
jgi:hypothetical protein